tara:strand:+ start:4427 stop:5293 length:867 start_codon:yes stop_codon:yes gene_type:complete
MDYYNKYLKYKTKYLNLKTQIKGEISESTKFDVCTTIKGLKQSKSTCWFDSVMMALLIPTNMNKLWSPALKSKYNITYSKLVEDNDYSLRIAWLNKYGTRGSGIPDTIDEEGYPKDLLDFLIHDLNINQGENLEYYYGRTLKKNNIIEINEFTDSIIPDNITFKNSPDFFACIFNPRDFPRQLSIKIKKNFSTNSNNYLLEAMIIVKDGHIISYVNCRDNWYVYDNERAKEKKPLLKIGFELTKEGDTEYYKFDDYEFMSTIWSPNRTIKSFGIKTNESYNIYLYTKI